MEVLILIVSFIFLLSIGVPIAYSIGLSAMFTLMVSIPLVASFTTVAQRMATGLDSFSLIAIPFFILAGELMNRGGIARRLIDFAKALVGMLPGGLAYVNIMACMLFGAISGSAIAATSAIGGIMNKRMEKEGYDKAFSAAVNITSSTTGLVIPPSNILIVFSLASGSASIAALFLAGYLPGILVGFFLMAVAGFYAYRNKYPVAGRMKISTTFMYFVYALPSLFLLVVVIGGIIAGIFTATEASAIAVLYAFILSVVIYREIKLNELPEILLNAAKTTSIVLLLIGTSMTMSWAMSIENIPRDVSLLMLSVSDNKIIVLLIINFILLLVGVFMDITPAVLIFTPIFLPVVTRLGVDPVHFGIIMVLNLCIGLCTPPVGSVLFVGCSVAKIRISEVIRPLLPLFAVMILALLMVTFIPPITLWLPEMFGF
ncbi:MAG: TRAP transporter large permease subunit [Bacteroidetes bacterium]|nr:TRAP transporter large permease subunit [Bacteroidota bacterium]